MSAPETEVVIQIEGAEAVRHLVRPGEYVLGRAEDADLRVEAELVSRRHAQLTINYDHALIEDLGSSNGTFVNGQSVTDSTRLWPGQKIQLGAATIELRRRKVESDPDVTLPPAEAALQRLLPEELQRDRKYDIAGQVAQGGMGAILEAREAAIERRVAMKVMLNTSKEDDVNRFVAEAKITGQLEHPNIVPVHELGVDENGQVFYTMKFVRGITLKKVLDLMATGAPETLAKYSLPVLLTIFQKTCDAVAFAHSKGVIHRDLKPENLMLGDFGEVLVMDWGLAKVLGSRKSEVGSRNEEVPMRSAIHTVAGVSGSTQAGTIMGTPQYMSPEQANGEVETLDARTDIYALGAILYHLLALRPPVTGATVEEVLEKVRKGDVALVQGGGAPSPRVDGATGRGSPSSLLAVVRKAMALRTEDRYASVPELQAEIAAYQAGFATSAEKASLLKQTVLLIKRHKGIFTTAAAAWAIITALAIWFLVNVTRERDRAEAGEVTATRERHRAESSLVQAEENLRQLQFRKAIEALDAELPREGLARLASVLRAHPDHPTVGSLILSTLSHHSFILPARPPLVVATDRPNVQGLPQFSAEGRLLVFGSDLKGQLWNPHTGQPLGPRLGLGRHAFFLRDGRRVVIGGNLWNDPEKAAREVAVWDTVTGEMIKVLPHDGMVISMALSEDGARLFTGTLQGRISIWNTTTLEKDAEDLVARAPIPTTLTCSADGRQILVKPRTGTSEVWKLPESGNAGPGRLLPGVHRSVVDPAGRGLFTFERGWWRLLDFDGEIFAQGRNPARISFDSIAASADGSRLLPLSFLEKSIRLWSVAHAQPIGQPLFHGAGARHADFGPADWRIFTVGTNREIALWSGRDGRPLAPHTSVPVAIEGDPNSGATYRPAFSPVEDLVVLRGHRSWLPLYDLRYRAEVSPAIHRVEDSCRSTLSPDGRWLLLGDSEGKVVLYDAVTLERRAELGTSPKSNQVAPVFSADSRLVACPVAGYRVQVWEIPSGKLRGDFEFGAEPGTDLQIRAVLSGDGQHLAAAGTSTADAVIWNTAAAESPPPRPHARGTTLVLEFSPDGALLAHGLIASAKPFRMLDAATRQVIWEIPQQARDANFSPTEPSVALALNQAGVQLYGRGTGALRGSRLEHGSEVSIVRFSPDGRRLATVGADFTVRLWDVATGAAFGEPMPHASAVASLAFSPDSRRLATGTRDGDLRIWATDTAQPLSVSLKHSGAIADLAFTPDGRRLHANVRLSEVRIYEVLPAPQPTPLWLADLAEAVATARLGSQDELTTDGVPDFWPTRERLLAETMNDPYWGRWLRWFCADPATRTISAFSKTTMPETLEALIASNKRDALELALLHRPRDPAIMTALAKAIRAAGKDDATHEADAAFLEALAALRKKMPAPRPR